MATFLKSGCTFREPAGPSGDEDVRPIYWQDNYVPLLLGETLETKATYAASDLGGAKPAVQVDGWNVEMITQQ